MSVKKFMNWQKNRCAKQRVCSASSRDKIPVKNHMSVLTEQQEKYFRNNFNREREDCPEE
jgi:translation initiation factor IF-2